ncbi:MAG: hypothetical protein V1679_00445 [Candidatus Peregrinibacteria bacterium]
MGKVDKDGAQNPELGISKSGLAEIEEAFGEFGELSDEDVEFLRGMAGENAEAEEGEEGEDEKEKKQPLFVAIGDVKTSLTLDLKAMKEGIENIKHALKTKYAEDLEWGNMFRPNTRAECLDFRERIDGTLEPCPFVSCKYHLLVDVDPERGSLKINWPHVLEEDMDLRKMPATCALDVAERGGVTLEDVGIIMNLTRERIRQVEFDAKSHYMANQTSAVLFVENFHEPNRELRDLDPELPGIVQIAAYVERVAAELNVLGGSGNGNGGDPLRVSWNGGPSVAAGTKAEGADEDELELDMDFMKE